MKRSETKKITIVCVLLGTLFFLSAWYVQDQQAEYVSFMKLLIAEQEGTLISIAEVTNRGGADAVTNAIIKDCKETDRQRFDYLLDNLATLNRAELVESDLLFGACASFFAQRKAIMTARFEREYQVYKDYVALLNITDARSAGVTYPLQQWEQLVALERELSGYADDVVRIQGEIITQLLEGVSAKDEVVRMKIDEAQNVKESYAYTQIRINALREELLAL